MKYFREKQNLLIIAILSGWFFVSCSTSNQTIETTLFFNPDTVKAQRFDTGKMWTFEDAPTDYFFETYNLCSSLRVFRKYSCSNDLNVNYLVEAFCFISIWRCVLYRHMLSVKFTKKAPVGSDNSIVASPIVFKGKCFF